MEQQIIESEVINKMFEAGAHLAFTRSRRHASVKNFVFGKKHNLDILDLNKTEDFLANAEIFVKKLATEGKTILFVGTKPEARAIIKKAAEEIGALFVTERWIGGLFTNFTEVKKRIDRLTELKNAKEKREFNVYTKKEQGHIEKELEKLIKKFGGVEQITKTPDALFVVDSKKEEIAVAEAKKIGIPVVSLSGSDCDITKVTYPIVANDASLKSIAFFVERIKDAYKDGLK